MLLLLRMISVQPTEKVGIKAIETGIIDRPSAKAAVIFVKRTKISDTGTSERVFINSLKLSIKWNCFLVQRNHIM